MFSSFFNRMLRSIFREVLRCNVHALQTMWAEHRTSRIAGRCCDNSNQERTTSKSLTTTAWIF
uniref:Candidate secreted effector n=1 Tax=Meloidogyne incognita TaxID=6306 RepID=A0A914MMY2_MELIC